MEETNLKVKVVMLRVLLRNKQTGIRDFKAEFKRQKFDSVSYYKFNSNLKEMVHRGLVSVINKKPLIVRLKEEKRKGVTALIVGWEECLKD